MLQLRQQELYGIGCAHRIQNPSQDEGFLKIDLVDQKFFLTRAGLQNIHSRIHALVGNLAVQDDLGVTFALEFLEDDFVHPAACVDQRCRDDGQ